MSLRFGQPVVASPGPSIIPDRVLAAMAKPMPDLYGAHIEQVYAAVADGLNRVVGTTSDGFMVIGNGHAGWQMAIANTLSPQDRVLVLNTGLFAEAWGAMAGYSGVKVDVLESEPRRTINLDAVTEHLAADKNRQTKAVLMVQTDTAISVRNDVKAVRSALDALDHPALLMVDCIASLGCDEYQMDNWGVDLTVGACQKGLMVPPGLAFVWAGPRALEASKSAGLRTSYFDWDSRLNYEAFYQLFAGTPPISHLYGLAEAVAMIDEEGGIEAVWRRHEILASAVHAAVDQWATPGALELAITNPQERSAAVTTVLTGSIDVERLGRITETGAGLTLGQGIGDLRGSSFRIGHMGHLNPPMILGTLATIEAGLAAMNAPMRGSGVAAASAALAPVLAQSG